MIEMYERPECACYQHPHPRTGDVRDAMITEVGQHCGLMFGSGLDAAGVCNAAQGHALELVIITLATVAALRGTQIECGTQEAQWETERVLTGIEERLLHKLRWMHEQARLPENEETTKKMREETR